MTSACPRFPQGRSFGFKKSTVLPQAPSGNESGSSRCVCCTGEGFFSVVPCMLSETTAPSIHVPRRQKNNSLEDPGLSGLGCPSHPSKKACTKSAVVHWMEPFRVSVCRGGVAPVRSRISCRMSGMTLLAGADLPLFSPTE